MQALNLKQLEVFCAVVEQGSFTAAAEKLYLAQSTVSGHVAALEEDLGVPLLVRTGKRRISLTGEGRRVYAHARTILQSCEELSRELADQVSRELTVAASSIPMQYILPRLITDFAASAPDFRFILRDGDSQEVHRTVLQGEANLGFAGAVLDTREFRYDPIALDPLVLVTPDTSRFRELRAAGTAGNRLLREEPLIFREGGSGTQIAGQRFLTENGIAAEELNIVARIENSEALLRAVSCGLGCAVVSGLAAATNRGLISFPLVGKSTSRELYLIQPRDRRPTKAARSFIDFVLASTR
ncbi:MAG: LysR family transcriptional regulator [Oscillospiraceae bacterium]|nr:LysR family transcriptional regulator [Oscillospiraceae bacterium]